MPQKDGKLKSLGNVTYDRRIYIHIYFSFVFDYRYRHFSTSHIIFAVYLSR